MFGYYLNLALRSFKRNKVLTALMVLALGLGIGASITTLTVLKVLSGDPLPGKSARLFTPTINHGKKSVQQMPRWWGDLMGYRDAMNLMHARKAKRQAIVAVTRAKLTPADGSMHPFYDNGVMTTPDFFAMFGAQFAHGSGWTRQQGEQRARVAVISHRLDERLFGGGNSVGKTLHLADQVYRVIGVLKPWHLQPNFYVVALGGRFRAFGQSDAVFVPIQSARADHMRPGQLSCWGPGGFKHVEQDPCAWLGLWVELASPADVAGYRQFLAHYVKQQVAQGLLHHPQFWFYNLMDYLHWQQVVPDDVPLQTNLAFGFLLVCILNTVGLLLAKCLRRSREIGVRRALGASRRSIFAQFMMESAMVGLVGGVLGLVFALLGLWLVRHQPATYAHLAHLDVAMFLATFVTALVASLIAGLLPAWRACVIAPAPQLKSA